MKNILLIGVGGSGQKTLDLLYQKIRELGNRTDNKISALIFNLGNGSVRTVDTARFLQLSDEATVGTVCDRIGNERLREWFPVDQPDIRNQQMTVGMSLWRKKSYLAFLNLMYKKEARRTFHRALEEMANSEPGSTYEIYVIASTAGATGSGAFIPISLYAKQYIRRVLGITPMVSAMITCPDIYVDHLVPGSAQRAYANAYAVQRELNAINAVARGGRNGVHRGKNTSVSFRIGSKKEPVVGLLFDSEDASYWTPEAAPFEKVYVLDRIPGVHTIDEHNIVLADSLYTLICTNVGAAMDAEASNHMTLASQNNGGGAIFAGISTARIKFPTETVLDYLASERTLQTCRHQWLTLYHAVEEKIKERKQQAVEQRKIFTLSEAEYAALTLEAFRELDERNESGMEAVHRWTDLPAEGEEKRIPRGNTAERYYRDLKKMIGSRTPEAKPIFDTVQHITPEFFDTSNDEEDDLPPFALFRRAKNADPKRILRFEEYLYKEITGYYLDCLDTINNRARGIVDAILTFEEHRDPRGHKELSLCERILIKDGRYMHPVAAMVQLCRLRVLIEEKFKKEGELDKITQTKPLHMSSNVSNGIPMEFYASSNTVPFGELRKRHSRYYRMGRELAETQKPARLAYFHDSARQNSYLSKRSDEEVDFELMRQDALATLDRIWRASVIEMNHLILKRLCSRLDELIRQYRRFFDRFTEAEADAQASVMEKQQADSGKIGSILYVFSSKEQKAQILKNVSSVDGAESLSDLQRSDNMAGRHVFEIAMSAVRREKDDSGQFSDDRNMIRQLLLGMQQDNREMLQRNPEVRRLSGISVIEALEESCGKRTLPYEEFHHNLKGALENVFVSAMEMATPSLPLEDPDLDDPQAVNSSEIFRVLLSYQTATYIKKRAEIYRLPLPDSTDEEMLVQSAAEEFGKRYIHPKARICVVKNIPANVMYITGEKMDITPMQISKFNEMGKIPGYYPHYCEMINEFLKESKPDDFWNPHLGFGFQKRVVLPYINPAMEAEFDRRVVQAMLYGFLEKKLRFGFSAKEPAYLGRHFHYVDKEGTWELCCHQEERINYNNVSFLFDWLRNREQLVDQWSSALEQQMVEWKRTLPVASSDGDNDLKEWNRAVAAIPLIKRFRDGLYEVGDQADDPKAQAAKEKIQDRTCGLMEFAFLVKCCEEVRQDCNDAEKLLRYAFDLFEQFCLSSALISVHPELAIGIYSDQVLSLYSALKRSMTKTSKENISLTDESTDQDNGGTPQKKKKSNVAQSTEWACILSWISGLRLFAPLDSENLEKDKSEWYRPFDVPEKWEAELKKNG